MEINIFLGIAIMLGYIGGKISNKAKFPAVIGYILAGLLLGPSFLNIFKEGFLDKLGLVSDLTLGLVAFSIGTELRLGVIRKLGKGIVTIIFAESLGAFLIVFGLVYLVTQKLYLALLFGAMAPASAPAGTVVVLQEYRAKGPLTNALLTVVGLDDGLAILIYAFAAAIAKISISQTHISFQSAVGNPLIHILGAILLGLTLGFIAVNIAKKLTSRQELLVFTIASVFICVGISNILNFSLILSNLAFGAIIANTYLKTSRRTYGVIHEITPPLYVLFFVLAGAHLKIQLLPAMGLIGALYIAGRTAGLMGGAWLGAKITKAHENIRKYLGLGILSQAGVAIGLALLVGREFGDINSIGKEVATIVINTVAATTIFFEIIGPMTTKLAISRAGEIGKNKKTLTQQ
ncbi:MAG: cation:proton antiporter [Candidatus Omnitrophica bacterium]|nr:cation:proton antiporter [Candidatus Omnitrophota bacterium]